MANKKRKGVTAAVEQPLKKSKKNASTASEPKVAVDSDAAVVAPAAPANTSKKSARKKAADFLDDEDLDTSKAPVVKTSQKKSIKTERSAINGDKAPEETLENGAATSLVAEAEHTQDQELAEEYGGDDQDIDTAPALLTGFDSDTEDQAQDTADVSNDRTAPIPQFKKTSKKLRKAKESAGQDKPGAVYVGRIPHGFYEPQMRAYFSQFGDITRLRLSRNRKTGASKHFAFIEFTSEEVAKIVAETMDNYLMFGHILKCKFAPEGSLHEDVWKGANKKYRQIPHHKLIREKEQRPKTQEQWERKNKKEETSRKRKADKLKELGYEFENPQLKKPQLSLDANGAENEKQGGGLDVTGVIEPPATVPKDELATKKAEEKSVKTKRSKAKANADDSDAEAKRNTLVEEASRAEIDAAMKKNKKKEEEQAAKAEKQGKGRETKKTAPDAADGKKLKGILKKPKV